MTDLPDNVRKTLDSIQARMEAEQEESRVAFGRYLQERERVKKSYPKTLYNEMYKNYAKPYLDKSHEHDAIVDQLFCHYHYIQAYPWGMQEP